MNDLYIEFYRHESLWITIKCVRQSVLCLLSNKHLKLITYVVNKYYKVMIVICITIVFDTIIYESCYQFYKKVQKSSVDP